MIHIDNRTMSIVNFRVAAQIRMEQELEAYANGERSINVSNQLNPSFLEDGIERIQNDKIWNFVSKRFANVDGQVNAVILDNPVNIALFFQTDEEFEEVEDNYNFD